MGDYSGAAGGRGSGLTGSDDLSRPTVPVPCACYFPTMLALLKLIQSIIKTLHSDGTPGPGRRGDGARRGAGAHAADERPQSGRVLPARAAQRVVRRRRCWGGRSSCRWASSSIPLFDAIGLQPARGSRRSATLWTDWYNTPLLPYTNFNNSVVLGSVVGWLALAVPIFFAARFGVARYRATIGERVRRSSSTRR